MIRACVVLLDGSERAVTLPKGWNPADVHEIAGWPVQFAHKNPRGVHVFLEVDPDDHD